ncbi:MAG TPA: response regulator [Gemmataceae bacterium]|nr:response regulator [Gemmataceae bacterium]
MPESILIVDDEEPVRRTFRDWLAGSGLNVEVHAVPDAESALVFANRHAIDLAVLDWNLGSGSDGLRLLEDLVEFHPDLVAILVTGFAHQATPLDALRMGVRDYLDKNQDLNRETFLAAVRKQLERIIPAKRHRQFMQGLLQFRESVEKILPLVRSTATLNDPVPLSDAVRHLFRFLIRSTGSADGVLLARHAEPDGAERFVAFGPDGNQLPAPTIPFSRSLAATVLSMNEPCATTMAELKTLGPVELQPFEANRKNVLAAPVPVAAGTHVVIELFDKPGGFTADDRKLADAAADFSTELLRQALAERQTQRLLIDAVEAALRASESVSAVLPGATADPEAPLPPAVMDRLRAGLGESANAVVDAETSLKLAEAVRELAVRHGPAAVRHCVRMVESVKAMLDETAGPSP